MREPYKTQEKQLAFALMCAGGRFAPDEQDGPAINVYSTGFLRQSRFAKLFEAVQAVRKLDIEEAATMLIEREIPGIVTYVFVRDAVFDEFIAAWDGITTTMQEADQANIRPELPRHSATVVAQVMNIAANNLAIFAQVPFMNKARQMVSDVTGTTRHNPILNPKAGQDGAPQHLPGTQDVTTGKGRAWTIGLNAADKQRMGVTI